MNTRRSQLENTLSSKYRINPMGMAIQKHDGSMSVHHSDQPYAHVNEAQQMYGVVDSYLTSATGQQFLGYLESQNRELMKIVGYGAGDLGEGVVAALMHNGLEGVIVSNYQGKGFNSRVEEMAQMYHLSTEAALEYVLNHELAHASGLFTESGAEGFIKEYFLEQAHHATTPEEKAEYEALAHVATEREAQAYASEAKQ